MDWRMKGCHKLHHEKYEEREKERKRKRERERKCRLGEGEDFQID